MPDIAGNEAGDAQEQEACGVREGIVRLDLEQHGSEKTRGSDGPEHAENHAGGGENDAFSDPAAVTSTTESAISPITSTRDRRPAPLTPLRTPPRFSVSLRSMREVCIAGASPNSTDRPSFEIAAVTQGGRHHTW